MSRIHGAKGWIAIDGVVVATLVRWDLDFCVPKLWARVPLDL